MTYDGIPQELDYQQGSRMISVALGRRNETCSYWWRRNRLVADGRYFSVWLAAATGLEGLLQQYPATRRNIEDTYVLSDDRPTWWVRDTTDRMMVRNQDVPGASGLVVVAATPFEPAEDKHMTAAQQEAELLRLAAHAIVSYVNDGPDPTLFLT